MGVEVVEGAEMGGTRPEGSRRCELPNLPGDLELARRWRGGSARPYNMWFGEIKEINKRRLIFGTQNSTQILTLKFELKQNRKVSRLNFQLQNSSFDVES